MSITSPLTRPSPNGRRVGIRIVTFEACSVFTHVTARRIAQLPKATFVTRLQPLRLPARAARQLPDQSTTLRVESSSTGNPRLRGALPQADICTAANCTLFDYLVDAGEHRLDVDGQTQASERRCRILPSEFAGWIATSAPRPESH